MKLKKALQQYDQFPILQQNNTFKLKTNKQANKQTNKPPKNKTKQKTNKQTNKQTKTTNNKNKTKQKNQKKYQVILSALHPLTCYSTRPQHTLQMFADLYGPKQTMPWETINQGLLQPQGELYPILTIAAWISSSSFVRVSTRQLTVSFLSKGISSTLNFHESIGTEKKCLNGLRTNYTLGDIPSV